MNRATAVASGEAVAEKTAFTILSAISFSHLLNDLVQSLLPAMYPLLKSSFGLQFSQIGLLTLVHQMTASILQPAIGLYTDHRPKPYSLPIGMGISLIGLVLLSVANGFASLLLAAGLIGVGSAIFHPEASRVARQASGGRLGLAQSLFQVGGNFGTALGPLAAAFVVLPNGQASVSWFSLTAILAIVLLACVGAWCARRAAAPVARTRAAPPTRFPRRTVAVALAVLGALLLSKYVYLASMTSYFTFYLMERFGISAEAAQLHLFIFLGAVAAGTIIGGPVGDRIGRKPVIWGSILGVLPFTLALPYAGLVGTTILSIIIGLILASAFSAIVVYAQELVPGKVGMVGGLVFGFAFGAGAIGAAVLGGLADATDIIFVYKVCSFLPLLGLLTIFLPKSTT